MAKLHLLILISQVLSLQMLGSTANSMEEMMASLLQAYTSDQEKADVINNLASNIDGLKNMASLFGGGAGQGRDDSGAAAMNLLSSLGSLLSPNGQFNPSGMGNILSMLGQTLAQGNSQVESREKRDDSLNLDGLLGLASAFLGQNQGQGSAVPMIMSTLGSMLSDTTKRAEDHKDHAEFLPPFIEKLHLYWDVFINSELGKMIYEKSGVKKAMKMFTGPEGELSFQLMLQKLENPSFRRHWIKAASQYLTDMILHIAKPEVYQKYLTTGQFMINSFLEAQGMPKTTFFSIQQPGKSLSALVNHILRRYLSIDTDATEYVNSAVEYIKKTVAMAGSASKKLATRSDYNSVLDHVTDTLNLEVIEPVMRVYRAYKHAVEAPHCAQHLLCLVNKHGSGEKASLTGFKASLTKVSSLIASAAISYQSGKPFWDLYDAISADKNCEVAFPADCHAFHKHELKVTTEVYHSEL